MAKASAMNKDSIIRAGKDTKKIVYLCITKNADMIKRVHIPITIHLAASHFHCIAEGFRRNYRKASKEKKKD